MLLFSPADAGQKPRQKHTQKVQQKHKAKPKHKKRRARVRRSKPPAPFMLQTSLIDSTDSVRTNLLKAINQWTTVPYRRGGLSEGGIDCSGFTKQVFQDALAIVLPHSARAQSRMGSKIARADLMFGDLIFFQNAAKLINHVGIYIADNLFVHSHSGSGVTIDSLSERYYSHRFFTARRFLEDDDDTLSSR